MAPARSGLVGKLLRGLSLEPAFLAAFAARVWQSLAGLGTIYFFVEYLTPEAQGYYQTFLSLISLQSFLELGINVAIISVASHEWAGLTRDARRTVLGDENKVGRLAAMTKFVGAWFGGAALLLLIGGGTVGYAVLIQHGQRELWLGPWIAAIFMASGFLWCQGLIAVLEGCNQILEVALYRLVQGVASVLVLWLAVVSGAGIWSLAAMLGTNLVCALTFLGFAYRHFFAGLLFRRGRSTFRWQTDMWPMQWPLALQGITNYFMLSLFVPVVFSFHGVVEAGRMGLSIQVVMALLAIATTWLTIATPRMGTAFASGDHARYQAIWRRASAASILIILLGALAASAVIWVSAAAGIAAIRRFLDPLPFSLLLLWGVSLHLVQCMAAYWRAQRREPLRFWGVAPGAATGAAVWLLGREAGALGAAAGALAASLSVGVPIAFYFLRRSRIALAGEAVAASG